MQIIAHRGLRDEAPENSLEAISAALKLPSIYGVEFDVELTRDDQLVVLHQETVVPSSDLTRIELAERNHTTRDWVGERDAKDILKMDAGSWMSQNFRGVTVPSLADVLALEWRDVVAFVELKDATYWSDRRDVERPGRIVAAAELHFSKFPGRLNVISFNPEVLQIARSRLSSCVATLALWKEWRFRQQAAMQLASSCGASTLSLPDEIVLEDPSWVAALHKAGFAIHVYPVSPARGEKEYHNWSAESQVAKWRRLKELGIDGMLSDFARSSLATLGEYTQ